MLHDDEDAEGEWILARVRPGAAAHEFPVQPLGRYGTEAAAHQALEETTRTDAQGAAPLLVLQLNRLTVAEFGPIAA